LITKGDDYPLHQTPDPVAYTGASRNFYDRYFFNGYDRDGEVFFALALGVYPYVNVMDGAFSVIIDGIQHNSYASKVMHMERLDTEVGPIKIEIIEPLRVLRIVCDDKENRISADLTFTGRTPAHEEPRFLRRNGSQIMMDVTRMMQNGVWTGWFEVKGKKIEVQPENFRGTRDRSWGIRGIGEADPQPNPYAMHPQFYWLWAPLNFEGFGTHYFVNDDKDGISWNSNGVAVPLIDDKDRDDKDRDDKDRDDKDRDDKDRDDKDRDDKDRDDKDQDDKDQDIEQMSRFSSKLEFVPGTRHAKRAEIEFTSASGEDWHFELTTRWNFNMKGIGYGHAHWGHGSYHGELETGYDEFVVAEIEPLDLHVQAMCDVLLTTSDGEHRGQGVLEQIVFGPHAPSGFKEQLDMAK